MRGEDGNDKHAAQPFESFAGPDTHPAHFTQGTFKRPALAAGLTVQAQGHAAAFAVVCFSKIDELEVKRKRAGELIGGG